MSTITPGDGDPRHGTRNGYINLKCRCQDCRTCWAEYGRNRRHRRAQEVADGTAVVEHGKSTTYHNWGCRCGPCTAASTLERFTRRRTRGARMLRLRSPEEKRRVVERALETGVTRAAREAGVARSMVYDWGDALAIDVRIGGRR